LPVIGLSALSQQEIRVGKFFATKDDTETRRFPINKKYIVWLTDQEWGELVSMIENLRRTSEKVQRAYNLLRASADGLN
jgi:hypothetical protein